MNEFITALLYNLRDVNAYEKYKGMIKEWLDSQSPNWTSSLPWLKRTGILNSEVEELLSKIPLEERERFVIQLTRRLFPNVVIQKHPQKRVFLIKLETLDKPLFYLPEEGVVQSPSPDPDSPPRRFTEAEFIKNLPKIDEFIRYINKYRLVRKGSFSKEFKGII